MAWPNSLESISSNLNTTELWVLKEKLDNSKYKCTNITGFSEHLRFDVEIHGEVYEFTEMMEMIDSVYRKK